MEYEEHRGVDQTLYLLLEELEHISETMKKKQFWKTRHFVFSRRERKETAF